MEERYPVTYDNTCDDGCYWCDNKDCAYKPKPVEDDKSGEGGGQVG